MAILNFPASINSSLQIGDALWCAKPGGKIIGITEEPFAIGVVESFSSDQGVINYVPNTQVQPLTDDYILFSKPIQVNESSIKGYYADVTLVNNSNKKAELFAVSSEIALSSK